MMFTNVQEAFNHYRTASVEEIERRAADIKRTLETDAGADIDALNIEIEGLRQAKENQQEKRGQQAGFNPITGITFEQRASHEATEGDVLTSAEYRSAFFKSMLGHNLTQQERAAWNRAQEEKRADAFSTTTNTAAVIPTHTLNEVISKARTMGGLLGVCRGFNIPAKISIPVGTPSSKAAWNTEGHEVDSGHPDVATVNFGNYEIIKVFSISASVKRMSVPAFESYLVDELASCVLACLADGLVSGTGTNQGMGILPGVTWTDGTNAVQFTGGTAAARTLAYADIVNTIAKLKRGYANGAVFAMNNTTLYTRVYSLTDENKRPIFLQDAQMDTIGKLLGFPVIVDDYLPDDTLLFGNFSYMGYNLPEGIAVEASTQSSFKSGRIDYRAMAIADCKPIVTEAFVKLYKA